MARKLQKFMILFDNPNLLYFPGHFISGRVIVELEEDTSVLGETLLMTQLIISVAFKNSSSETAKCFRIQGLEVCARRGFSTHNTSRKFLQCDKRLDHSKQRLWARFTAEIRSHDARPLTASHNIKRKFTCSTSCRKIYKLLVTQSRSRES
ncbi:hypothetical protein E2C01_054510 [Portunus trituberculatus]|uniref:Arrestin-like N-terminal domain-containing protein n=1 Tax=Portunus trituberculatus TaxID=210409 RepID=A0A5B7GSV2_PORTR|nr:hypothetical protein [Portunus trituberculatus]